MLCPTSSTPVLTRYSRVVWGVATGSSTRVEVVRQTRRVSRSSNSSSIVRIPKVLSVLSRPVTPERMADSVTSVNTVVLSSRVVSTRE